MTLGQIFQLFYCFGFRPQFLAIQRKQHRNSYQYWLFIYSTARADEQLKNVKNPRIL